MTFAHRPVASFFFCVVFALLSRFFGQHSSALIVPETGNLEKVESLPFDSEVCATPDSRLPATSAMGNSESKPAGGGASPDCVTRLKDCVNKGAKGSATTAKTPPTPERLAALKEKYAGLHQEHVFT